MAENSAGKINLSGNATKILEKRYLQKGQDANIIETPEEMFKRVASNIALVEKKFGKDGEKVKQVRRKFYNIMATLQFLPNSPTLMNAGTKLQQLSACFVLSVDDSIESIYQAIKHTAIIHKSGGGTGFSFSRIRPNGSPVGTTSGVASGPVSFMKVFDASTEAIKQGGRRRGANMGILDVNHPDIMEFIASKQKEGQLKNFNISVAVNDAFMEATQNGEDYELIDPRTGEITGKLNADEVLDKIAEMAWRNGEPGIIFLDRINQLNPTPHVGKIESTNPCVTEDTWTMTAEGPRQVKDLIRKGFWGVVNGEKWKSRDGFFKTGMKPVYKIRTVEGFHIRLTENHQVRRVNKITTDGIYFEWTKAGSLRREDKIILNNHRSINQWNGGYTEEEGYLIGLLLGNGTTKKGEVVLSPWGKSEGAVAVRKLVSKYTHNFPHRSEFKGGVLIKGGEEHCLFTGYLRSLTEEIGLARNKKGIIEKIEKTSSCFYKGFLRGLFDADGFVQVNQIKGGSIRLPQSNLKMLKAVQRMLLRLGIFSKIHTHRRKNGEKNLPEGKNGFKKYRIKAQYELVISKDSVLHFYKRIGFGDSDKMKKLRGAIKNYKKNMGRERFLATVDSVIPDGTEEVYDVQIPGVNAFDANGFYVHNCGEQPLLPYESCNLSSINLARFVEKGKINWDKLREVVHDTLHFLDNVIDANRYPLSQIEKNTKANRKVGLGIMGFADLLIKLNIPYNSKKAFNLGQKLMLFIQNESKKASQKLAEERGVFPNFKGSLWDKENLEVRNATTTTIAPTGSISMIADCSSGIEPLFSLVYYKEVLGGEKLLYIDNNFEKVARERDFYSDELMRRIAENRGSCQEIPQVPEEVKKIFVTALDIPYQDHIRMQAAFQKNTDNAVSKTINLPNEATKDNIKDAFILAYKLGCKGITVYRDRSREEQVLRAGKQKEEKALLTPRPRPRVTRGTTREIRTGCGDLYVTINENGSRQPFEIFAQLGKSGGCAASQTEAIGRLASLALRSGIPWSLIIKQLKGISCDRPWGLGKNRILSCADAVGKAIEMYIEGKTERGTPPKKGAGEKTVNVSEVQEGKVMGACPECGSSNIEHEGGCSVCRSCGYSECD